MVEAVEAFAAAEPALAPEPVALAAQSEPEQAEPEVGAPVVIETRAVAASEPVSLGGLVMVSTKSVVEAPAVQEPVAPAGPRRRDVTRQAQQEVAPAELVQVETRNP
ncbi:hypothetical protein JOS77_22100 [Chromobacterium haemolyticum]|nr:hypothetical protein JOS77_22100 [Chromobacterium haemolyticum]